MRSLGLLLLLAAHSYGLEFSKDTVFENESGASDQVSLYNPATNSVVLDTLSFVVTKGKYTRIQIVYFINPGTKKFFIEKTGDGPTVIIQKTPLIIQPKQSVVFTGFAIDNEIYRPAQGSSPAARRDSVVADVTLLFKGGASVKFTLVGWQWDYASSIRSKPKSGSLLRQAPWRPGHCLLDGRMIDGISR